MTYLAELQETRAAVREHGGEFNSFSRVLTGVLVRWGGTRGVSVTDLRTNLRSPPFLAKPGTHFDRLRVRAGGFEVFAGAEELVSLVLHARQLLGEGRDLDGRGHHGRSVTVLCATRHRSSSCQLFSNLPASGGRAAARVERPRTELNRRATFFFGLCICTWSSQILSDSFPFARSNRIFASRDPICQQARKNLSPIFTGFIDLEICAHPCPEHYQRAQCTS